jgi:SnoaL-like domain
MEIPVVAKEQRVSTTKEILDHYLKMFGEGNLDGILSDYAPTAVLFMPDGPLKGTDAMRSVFTAMFAEFGKPGAAFAIKHLSVDGDHAYIFGRQKQPTTFTRWELTRLSCGTARSLRRPSLGKSHRRAEEIALRAVVTHNHPRIVGRKVTRIVDLRPVTYTVTFTLTGFGMVLRVAAST